MRKPLLATLLAAASIAVALFVPRAFLALPCGRRAAAEVFSAAILFSASAARAAEPLSEYLEKEVAMSAQNIQDGMDWLYFEIKPALDTNDVPKCKKSLGSGLYGAHISPIENLLVGPLEGLLGVNLDSDEDGWLAAVKQIRAGIDEMKEMVSSDNFPGAIEAWKSTRDGANAVLKNINERSSKPYFTIMDENYDSRIVAYNQAKTDMMFERNLKGTMILR